MKLKKFLAGMLTAAMVLTSAPVSSLAAGEEQGTLSSATVETNESTVTITDIDLTQESSYAITDAAALNIFNSMPGVTLTVIGKFAEEAGSTAYALFSLTDDSGDNYITVWYDPNDGTACYAYGNADSKSYEGLYWSTNAKKIEPGENFKLSFSVMKNGNAHYLAVSVNGTCSRQENCSAYNFFTQLPAGRGWTATKALIGKAPVEKHPINTNQGFIADFQGTIDRVIVSNSSSTATSAADAKTKIENLNNAPIGAYKTKLQNILNECNYDKGSFSEKTWADYESAKTAAETKANEENSKDWEVLNAMDTLVAAIEGLSQSELAIKEGTICANSWYAETNASDGAAAWAFDKETDGAAKTDTWWHSNYSTVDENNKEGTASAANPVYIQAGFDGAKYVKKIAYRGRTKKNSNWIQDFEILAANSDKVKPDDTEFVSVMKGTLTAPTNIETDEKIIDLPYPVEATHIRIQVTSVHSAGYVTASNIIMYETSDITDGRQIVSLAGKAVSDDANKGAVSMTPSVGISGKDTQVTLTATPTEGHYFVKWTDESGDTVGGNSKLHVTVNSTDEKVYTANFAEGTDPYYEATRYWDKEKEARTLADQTDDDIWHYQIVSNNTWVDLPREAYDDTHPVNDELGAWCERDKDGSASGVSWSQYDKISRTQITPFSANMGLLWKASQKGYYSATLEEKLGSGTTPGQFAVRVSYEKDGESVELHKSLMHPGDNFNTRIAKVEAGEAIRIASYEHAGQNWAVGFKPMIVPKTAKEYAVQYLADLDAKNIDTDAYTTATATAYTTAKTDLKTAIAEGAQDTEEQITAKIEALETAKANLTKKPQIKNTSVSLGGKIGLTFYTDLTSLDGVTASFTVDGKEVEATPELINGVVACTYESAAKNMTDMVSVSITVNGDTITSPETSVSKNAQWLLSNSPDDATLNALLKAMLNYGAAAQKQFDYKSGDDSNLANAVLEPNDKQVPEIGNELDGTCVNMGVTAEGYRGISLVLKSGTAMKLYVAGNASIVLKKTDAQDTAATSTGELNNGFSFVTLENIAANHLQDEYTVEINNNSAGKVSPLYYCYLVSKEVNPDPDLKNLVNALYDYNQKALAYEKAHSQH